MPVAANPAPQILTDAYVAVNGTALSAWANKVSLTDEADQVEVSAFGGGSYRTYGVGLRKAEIGCTFFQDFQANAVDSILQPLYSSGGTFSVEVRPTSAAVSATNPKYTMTCRMYAWSPLDGGIGDASTIDVTFANAGTSGLVRGTS